VRFLTAASETARLGIRYGLMEVLMSGSSISTPKFVCKCDPKQRPACWPEEVRAEPYKDGYCVLHFPGKEKSLDFRAALDDRLEKKDYNFGGVWFPDDPKFSERSFETNAVFVSATFAELADFSRAIFGARADFTGAVFKKQLELNSAIFTARANFDDAHFVGNANFERSTFRARAGFNSAYFHQNARFKSATFYDRANFGEVQFNGQVNFRLTNFKDYVRFAATIENKGFLDGSRLDLREVKIDKPELVTFHSLELRRFWFVDVNASKFDFSNVKWKRSKVDEEVAEIRKVAREEQTDRSLRPAGHTLFGIACWNLAVNAEENHRYEEASDFRYLAMEARRREHPGLLHWLYFVVSGYGEKVIRPLVVLLGILALFAVLYAATARDEAGPLLRLWRGLSYSASVMTLQKPEPSSSIFVRGLVTLETVLGPVQAALLALAIRRKFMR